MQGEPVVTELESSRPTGDPSISQGWSRARRLGQYFSAIVAGVGVVVAGIGYLEHGAHFFQEVANYFGSRTELNSDIAAADERLSHHDWNAAWVANKNALEISPRDGRALDQQEQIALRWIEDVRLSSRGGPQTFDPIVLPLKAVLVERLTGAHGTTKADIQAHIGWANYLLVLAGYPDTDVSAEFDAAISLDPGNYYGHIMRAYWVLENGGPVDEARADLDTAVPNPLNPNFSDWLIMSGLCANGSDDFIIGAIQYANKIRLASRQIDRHWKQRVLDYYDTGQHDKELLTKISKALPSGDHVALLDYLKAGTDNTGELRTATFLQGYFSNAAGNKSDAMKYYGDIIAATVDKRNDTNYLAAKDAVARLNK
jgi:hypothetical protein